MPEHHPEQTVVAIRGCPVTVIVDQGLPFVAVIRWPDKGCATHLFTAGEIRELADALDQLAAAVAEQ